MQRQIYRQSSRRNSRETCVGGSFEISYPGKEQALLKIVSPIVGRDASHRLPSCASIEYSLGANPEKRDKTERGQRGQ